MLIALLVAACQTGHAPVEPVPASDAPAAAPTPNTATPTQTPGPSTAEAPSPEELPPAAIDPGEAAGPSSGPSDPHADAAWIDAVLQRRAPSLGTRARAAVALEVAQASDVHGLDPLVVLSIIAQESRFDPEARGRRRALGLMQIRPFVARDVARRHGIPWSGDSTLLDPANNVAIGTAYLGEILRQFGDLELALAGYNMGPYRLQRMLARGDAPEGIYLGRILTHYADLASLATELETGTEPCAELGC